MTTIRCIQQATADYFEIKLSDILGPSRRDVFSWPRQIAMHVSRRITGKSFPEIGRNFGGRDHTTVLHGINKVIERMDLETAVACSRIAERADLLWQAEVENAKEAARRRAEVDFMIAYAKTENYHP